MDGVQPAAPQRSRQRDLDGIISEHMECGRDYPAGRRVEQ